MRVLMFGWELPPYNSGGLGIACQGLARSLAENQVGLVFVLPKKMDVGKRAFKIVFANVENIKVRGVNSLLTPYLTSEEYSLVKSRLGISPFGSGLFEEVERYSKEAARISREESFDVIHAHDWLSFGAGIVAKKTSGKPLIAHVHATEFDRTLGNINQLIYEREREGLAEADRVISVSDYTKQTLIDKYGVQPKKIDVVENGIDFDSYYLQDKKDKGLQKLKQLGYKVVLFVGRITIMKGPDYFISAAKRVLEFNKKVIFVVSGSGDMEGQIMNQVASLGISDKVIFTGFLRGKELSSVYKSADLFVMPSASEPFGLTALESLAHNTPAIVSKQSGVSENIRNVFKVDFWDVEEMADKILSVINNKSLQETLRFNGHEEVQSHTWEKAAKKVNTIYNSLA